MESGSPPTNTPTPFLLQDPVHPRMRWERYRQWTGGEWLWMVLWKFQSHVRIKDAAFVTKIATELASRDYPDMERVFTPYLLWCRDFISRLVEEGRLSDEPGREGARLKDLRKIIADREERAQWMEAKQADDQLEAGEEPEGDEVPDWDGHFIDLAIMEPGMR